MMSPESAGNGETRNGSVYKSASKRRLVAKIKLRSGYSCQDDLTLLLPKKQRSNEIERLFGL